MRTGFGIILFVGTMVMVACPLQAKDSVPVLEFDYETEATAWDRMQFYAEKIQEIRTGRGEHINPDRAWEYAEVMIRSSQVHQVPPDLVFAIAWQESDFRNFYGDTDLDDPSVGIMQVRVSTYRQLEGREYTAKDLLIDFRGNIKGGVRYVRTMYNEQGSWSLALASYNAGPGRVDSLLDQVDGSDFESIKNQLPDITKRYVPGVMERIVELRQEMNDSMED